MKRPEIREDEDGRCYLDDVDVSDVFASLRSVGKNPTTCESYDDELQNIIFILESAAGHADMLRSGLYNSEEFLHMDGMTTEKVRHYLNNSCTGLVFSSGVKNYFEVGCASGSTYISSNFNSGFNSSYVCDNFGVKKNGENGKQIFLDNCEKYLKKHPENLIVDDCFSIDLDIFSEKINIYLFDGPHNIDHHEKALTYFEDIFDDRVVIFIDDWNDHRVQFGTVLGLAKINYDVEFWRYDRGNMHYCPFGVTIIPRCEVQMHHDPGRMSRGYSLNFGDYCRFGNGFMTLVLKKRDNK